MSCYLILNTIGDITKKSLPKIGYLASLLRSDTIYSSLENTNAQGLEDTLSILDKSSVGALNLR